MHVNCKDCIDRAQTYGIMHNDHQIHVHAEDSTIHITPEERKKWNDMKHEVDLLQASQGEYISEDELLNYYDKSTIDQKLTGLATTSYVDDNIIVVDSQIDQKLQTALTDYYNKQSVDRRITESLSNYYTKSGVDNKVNTSLSYYYNKSEVDSKISGITGSHVESGNYNTTTKALTLFQSNASPVSVDLSAISGGGGGGTHLAYVKILYAANNDDAIAPSTGWVEERTSTNWGASKPYLWKKEIYCESAEAYQRGEYLQVIGPYLFLIYQTGGTEDGISQLSKFSNSDTIYRDLENPGNNWIDNLGDISGTPIYQTNARKKGNTYLTWDGTNIWTEPVMIVLPREDIEKAVTTLMAYSATGSLVDPNEQRDVPAGWTNDISTIQTRPIYLTTARKQGSQYLKWSSTNTIWSTPIVAYQIDVTPGTSSIIMKKSDFDILKQLHPEQILEGVLYILTDDNGNIIQFYKKDGTTEIVSNVANSSTCTYAEWLSTYSSQLYGILYIVTDNGAIKGFGLNGNLVTIPLPASGEVVRCTQAEYDAAVEAGTIVSTTIYAIVENETIVKMYLGLTQIPIGAEATEAVVRSLVTQMFSEKFEFDTSGNLLNLAFSQVDVNTPGMASLTTGLSQYIGGHPSSFSSAGLLTASLAAETYATLNAFRTLNNDVSGQSMAISQLNTKTTDMQSTLEGLTTWKTNQAITTTGITSTASGNRSVITLMANYTPQSGGTSRSATIQLEVTNASSKLYLSAEAIDFTTGSYTINSDKIQFNGKLRVTDYIAVGTDYNPTAACAFYNTGRGHLANGNIEWDNSGNVTIHNGSLDAPIITGLQISGNNVRGGTISGTNINCGTGISLSSDGSGYVANGNIAWDSNGFTTTLAEDVRINGLDRSLAKNITITDEDKYNFYCSQINGGGGSTASLDNSFSKSDGFKPSKLQKYMDFGLNDMNCSINLPGFIIYWDSVALEESTAECIDFGDEKITYYGIRNGWESGSTNEANRQKFIKYCRSLSGNTIKVLVRGRGANYMICGLCKDTSNIFYTRMQTGESTGIRYVEYQCIHEYTYDENNIPLERVYWKELINSEIPYYNLGELQAPKELDNDIFD